MDARWGGEDIIKGDTTERVNSFISLSFSLLISIGRFVAPIHLEILQTLLLSNFCPRPVLCMCAQGVLRIFSNSKARGLGRAGGFDLTSVLTVASGALDIRDEGW